MTTLNDMRRLAGLPPIPDVPKPMVGANFPDTVLSERDLRAYLDVCQAELVELDNSEPGRVRVVVRFTVDYPDPVEVLGWLQRDLSSRVALGITWSVTLAGHGGPYR